MSRPPVSIFVRVPGMLGMCLLVAGFGVAPAVGYVHSAAAPTETSDPKDDEKESSDPKDGTTDPPAKEPKKDKDDQGKTEDKLRKTQIDPKLKEKLDELLDGQAVEPGQEAKKSKAGRAGRTRQDQPPKSRQPHRPAGQVPPRAKSLKPGEEPDAVDPESEQPDGSSTLLNIPPIDSDVPPEERTYIFSIKDGTYEQLVEGFARQTGLGVMGEAPKDGRVTFVSTEELSFEEALARVRMLLFNYKPHEPYWIERHETHLEVVRVNDILRVLPLDRMFKTLDDFRAANLRDDELALVIYTPKSGSVADLKVVRDFMPDYVRVAPLNGSSVTIFALVKDIKKYLQLKDILVRDTADPRTLERIEIKYILPTEAVDRLQELMDFDGGAGTSRPRSAGRAGRAKEITQLDTMPEPEVSLLPDNAQGILLVRAMQNKIEEIKRLLPYIDVDTSGQEHEPVVIPVEHADPAELISTVQQILGAFSTPRTSDGTKKPSSRRSRGSKAPTAPVVAADDITMLLHPSEAAIIVLADEEDIKRIRKLIEWLDKPGQVGPVKIPLEYADGTEIIATVTLVLEGGGGKGKGKTRPEQFQLMPDPGNEAVWFTGSERDLVKVRELVAILDVPEQAVSLHIIRLEHQKPSFVANILREYDGSAASSPAAASRKPRGKRGAKTVAASK
ncbi:MAG: secretin N-terminal domain-containing protein, partial [Phycisphaerae bacterium]